MDNFYSNLLDIYSNIFSFFQQEVQTFECSSTFDKYILVLITFNDIRIPSPKNYSKDSTNNSP